jgi:hypothetical protein
VSTILAVPPWRTELSDPASSAAALCVPRAIAPDTQPLRQRNNHAAARICSEHMIEEYLLCVYSSTAVFCWHAARVSTIRLLRSPRDGGCVVVTEETQQEPLADLDVSSAFGLGLDIAESQ